jgi:hypothetical protein
MDQANLSNNFHLAGHFVQVAPMPIELVDASLVFDQSSDLLINSPPPPIHWHDIKDCVHCVHFNDEFSKSHKYIEWALFFRVGHGPDFHRTTCNFGLKTTIIFVATILAFAGVPRALTCLSVFMLLCFTQVCSRFLELTNFQFILLLPFTSSLLVLAIILLFVWGGGVCTYG